MTNYNILASTDDVTVVAEYTPDYRAEGQKYQSEDALEKAFIKQLESQGYEYFKVLNEASFIDNLRCQLEKLNDFTFTDNEWERFFNESIANANEGIVEKTRKIQEDHVGVLRLDDGTSKNIYLIDKNNIHNNRLQVINQYEEDGGHRATRYDVTILVNGLPLIHIELKRRGIAIWEAFNQINRYQRDSFWTSHGLFEYVQLFVISNGTHTKRILNRITIARNYKMTGTSDAGGYIWHTTGERVIIVMGAICVVKQRVSGTSIKYISCIA